MCPPDLREGGDWYVGVQALAGGSAEFRLVTSLVQPPHVDRGHQCDPNEPECRGPIDGSLASSAPPRHRPGSRGAAGAVRLAATSLLGAAALALTARYATPSSTAGTELLRTTSGV